MKESKDVSALLKILKNSRTIGSSIFDQYGALDKIVEIGTEAINPLIEALAKEKDEVARWVSAEALGRIGDSRAVEPLINALIKDRHPDVRWHAAEALGQLGDKRALEPLKDASKDKDDWVRNHAKEALKKIKRS